MLRSVVPRLRPISPFETMKRYVPPSTLSRITANSLKLDYNEATIPAHSGVSSALRSFLDDRNLFLYPELDGGLLKDMLMQFNKLKTPNHELIVTPGSDEALRLLFAAFPGPVLVPQPSYPQVEMFGNVIVPFEPPEEAFKYLKTSESMGSSSFQTCDEVFRVSLIEAASSVRPGIIYLISPNNPNGQEVSEQSIRKIADKFPNSLVILDQAYHDFAAVPVSADFFEALPANLVVVRTFSKCLGLAALRLGYLFGSAELLRGVRNLSNSKAVSAAAQVAGVAVLENIHFYTEYADGVKTARQLITDRLRSHAVPVIVGGGNFLCIRVAENEKVETVVRRLEHDHDIFVRDVSGRFPGFFRVTVPGDQTQTRRLLKALEVVLI